MIFNEICPVKNSVNSKKLTQIDYGRILIFQLQQGNSDTNCSKFQSYFFLMYILSYHLDSEKVSHVFRKRDEVKKHNCFVFESPISGYLLYLPLLSINYVIF